MPTNLETLETPLLRPVERSKILIRLPRPAFLILTFRGRARAAFDSIGNYSAENPIS